MTTPGIYWRHGVNVLRDQGPVALSRLLLRKANRLLGRDFPGYYDFGYARWRQSVPRHLFDLPPDADRPRFSIIVPVYNVEQKWLEQTVASVVAQRYSHWQCVLVNDGSSESHVGPLVDRLAATDQRIDAHHLSINGGIAAASQAGLSLADGDYVALLDHDDLLTDDALLAVASLLSTDPDADLIYSDEDKVDQHGRFSSPFFKPHFSPTLLESQNYISHLLVLKRSLIEEAGGFRPGFDGAQDYDLVLRASRAARAIRHIPRVLYHWRQIPGSTAMGVGEKSYAAEAGRRALQSHIDETTSCATVAPGDHPGTYQISRPITLPHSISVIIPFRDQPTLLENCLSALFARTEWPALEVICVDNQSTDDDIDKLRLRWSRDLRVRFIDYDQPFNFAAICNHAVAQSSGDYVVLLNNDVQITADHWLPSLLQHATRPGVGAVGGLLHYPDNTVQHAGIVLGIGGSAGHAFKGFASGQAGYYGRLKIASNVSAVTGALIMIEKKKWLEVGGMDELRFAIALNDVDLCLRLLDAGYRNVLEPRCHGIHEESRTRGADTDPANNPRYVGEVVAFRHRWQQRLAEGDPYYNQNLTLDAEDYSLNWRQAS